MAKPVGIYTASDYAGLDVGEREFYYGYEFGSDADGSIWGFYVKDRGTRIYAIPYAAMAARAGCPEQFDTQACLLFGIGLALAEIDA